MKIQNNIRFDMYMPNIKAQTQARIFEVLAEDLQDLCGAQSSVLMDIFNVRLSQRTFGMGDGVAIFDVKSTAIKRPVMLISTFDQDIDFDALDGRPVDIMAAVISPISDGSAHLQRLAGVSRLLKCDDLQQALRDAEHEDAMRVLFMPSQDWMIAA
jgi:PTS system nitrogen regulatory IIA component